jgi:FkbM family methyltransferase
MSHAEHKIRSFLKDIEPFFHTRPVVYVDVGAYDGGVFREVFQSGLKPVRAYLVEPNPASYARLKETVSALGAERIATCYNIALGAEAGALRLRAQDTMTKVLAGSRASVAEIDADFEISAQTLDALAAEFVTSHVSLLKIDVEGFESEVLTGAAGLLRAQSIDMIYIEAGLDPETRQQTYYRKIEDGLRGYGYRLFRIYEQHNEWAADSPVLRRMNLAFISAKFAEGSPLRLSKELFALRRDHEELQRTSAERERALATLREEAAAAAEKRAAAEARGRQAKEAAAELEAELEIVRKTAKLQEEALTRRAAAVEAEASRRLMELRSEFDELKAYCRELERRHKDMLKSETWRAMEPVRGLMRLVRRRQPPKPFVPRLEGGELAPGPRKPSDNGATRAALQLEAKLWGGFSRRALAELEALRTAPGADPRLVAEASWVIARWQAAEGDTAAALENVVRMRSADTTKRTTLRCTLLEADCLVRLGRAAEARARIEEALGRAPGRPDLLFAMANTYRATGSGNTGPADEARRLDWINRIYIDAGLAPLVKHDPALPLAIANLATAPVSPEPGDAADAAGAGGAGLPKVSVIMPAFRAARTLPFALRGLLAQSWRNLEILVVDDCSPDDTHAVAEAIAAGDPRVRVLRQPENRGGYAARNAGLMAATGDFITTHDSDDWSHPEKIARQARHLIAEPGSVACFSDWARCSADLAAGWLFRAWGGYIAKNMSSIMLRREAFAALGGWDDVRVGADTDLLRRLERRFGLSAIGRVMAGVPLALSLHEAGSLTRQGPTHVRTMLHGARREYDEAGRYWREKIARPADLRFPPDRSLGERPFPAPPVLLGPGAAPVEADLLFVSDFSLKGGAFVSTFNSIEAARAAGMSTALFHWRRHDLDVTQPLNPAVRRLAQEGAVRIVSPGEAARARTVIVGYPAILTEPVDHFPAIESENLVVVINQMASRLHGGGDPQYDPHAIRATLRDTFGREGHWAPISGLVARLMRADPRYPAPSSTVWVPLIDTATWCAAPLRWRGGAASEPVIGRHARDHYTKWPSAPEALRAAYCVDRPARVELMGGAERALAVIGAQPGNWTVHRFGAMEAPAFLDRLDFFVHYPHEEYIEEFGRAVLEAIAAGKPAILPPVFRESFGEAAVYAEPTEVWDRIDALWRDEAAYRAQAERGRAFVRAHADWTGFPDRLARTLAETPAAQEPLRDSTA